MMDINYYNDNFLPGNLRTHLIDDNSLQSLNSHYYRCPEFESVEWDKSVVIFGCSNVAGVGLHVKDTISFQLEQLINRPVINMGVPASSIAYSVFNQLVLAEKNVKPHAVINLWTTISRLTYFSPESPIHIGNWTREKTVQNKIINRALWSMYQSWNISDSNPLLHSLLLQRFAKLMWKDTQHIEGTFFKNTSQVLDVELFYHRDFASDGEHPGPKAAKAVALRLVEQIK
jgi:hypothetical protein